MTGDQRKNAMTGALSAKGEVRTLDLFWVEAAEEDLLETRPRCINSSFWCGMKRQREHSVKDEDNERRQSTAVGKFHWWNDTKALTQLSRVKVPVSTTTYFPSFRMMMMNWCLMSSDVMRHIRDKLWPMPKHGAINLYVHGNQKAR